MRTLLAWIKDLKSGRKEGKGMNEYTPLKPQVDKDIDLVLYTPSYHPTKHIRLYDVHQYSSFDMYYSISFID